MTDSEQRAYDLAYATSAHAQQEATSLVDAADRANTKVMKAEIALAEAREAQVAAAAAVEEAMARYAAAGEALAAAGAVARSDFDQVEVHAGTAAATAEGNDI